MSSQGNRDADGGTDSGHGHEEHVTEQRAAGEELSRWLAESVLRVGLVLVGLVLLVYALGRAVDVDLLSIVVDALLSPIGRWLVVAFFALLLIVVAQRGFRDRI